MEELIQLITDPQNITVVLTVVVVVSMPFFIFGYIYFAMKKSSKDSKD